MSRESLTPNSSNTSPIPPSQRWVRTPPIDIFETTEGLVLRADLPGVAPESLELQVQDNKLSLFGRVNEPVEPTTQLLHQEFHVGDFVRSFILSDDVDHDRIRAKLADGVLELTLPRVEKVEPRRIPVQGGGQGERGSSVP